MSPCSHPVQNKHVIHPKLCNINLHNINHSLIYQNPRERTFVVQNYSPYCHISLPYITNLSWMQATKEVIRHPRIVPCVNIWSVVFFFFLCHLLNVGACICHITWEGQVEWTTPTRVERRMKSHPIVSHATLIQ